MSRCCSHLCHCRTGIEFPLENKHTLVPFMSVNNPHGYRNGMTQPLWVGRIILCLNIKKIPSYVWSDKLRILLRWSSTGGRGSVCNSKFNLKHRTDVKTTAKWKLDWKFFENFCLSLDWIRFTMMPYKHMKTLCYCLCLLSHFFFI